MPGKSLIDFPGTLDASPTSSVTGPVVVTADYVREMFRLYKLNEFDPVAAPAPPTAPPVESPPPVSAATAAAIRDGVHVWHEFEDNGGNTTFLDITGLSRPLTLAGGKTCATIVAEGRRGRCVSFPAGVADVSTDRLYFPRANTTFDKGNVGFGYAHWCRLDELKANLGGFSISGRLSGFDFASKGCYGITYNSDTSGLGQCFEFLGYNNSGAGQVVQHAALRPVTNATGWVLLGFGHNAADNKISGWVNNVKQTSAGGVTGGIRTNDNSNFSFNRFSEGDSTLDTVFKQLAWSLDEFVFFDHFPSDAEMAYLWKSGPPAASRYYSDVVLDAASVPLPSAPPPPPPAPPPPAPAPPAAGVSLALRPFAPNSAWNVTIPSNATYAASNDARITTWKGIPSKMRVNVGRFTQWVWYSNPADPVRTVFVAAPGNFRPKTVTVKFASTCHPDPGYLNGTATTPYSALNTTSAWGNNTGVQKDAHFTLIDENFPGGTFTTPEGTTVVVGAGVAAHTFWHMKYLNGQYQAYSYALYLLSGSGFGLTGPLLHSSGFSQLVYTAGWGAGRAYGGHMLGGLIRAGEITGSAPIQHALFMSMDKNALRHTTNYAGIAPATSEDGATHAGYTGTIFMGTRMAIPRSVNVSALGLSAPMLKLAVCLQDYGAFCCDASDGVRLNSDGVAAQADGNALNANPGQLDTIHNLMVPVSF